MGGDREWTLIGQLFPTFVATLLSAELVSAASIETTTQLCASCHGEHGLPSDPTVPIIWGQQAAYIQTELNAYRNGDRESQIMSSIAESLSNAEMSQIAAYFGHAKWPVRSDAPPSAPAPGAIATCQACHNANLAGGMGPTGVAPRLAGQFSPVVCVKFSNLIHGVGRAGESPASVAAVTARWVDGLQLLEIELGNGVQLLGQPRPAEAERQIVEPSAVFVL